MGWDAIEVRLGDERLRGAIRVITNNESLNLTVARYGAAVPMTEISSANATGLMEQEQGDTSKLERYRELCKTREEEIARLEQELELLNEERAPLEEADNRAKDETQSVREERKKRMKAEQRIQKTKRAIVEINKSIEVSIQRVAEHKKELIGLRRLLW